MSRAVLVGAFDETTPSVEKVLQRLGVAQENTWGESSVFFVLTAEAFDTTVAAITGIRFPDGTANSGTGGHPAAGGTAGPGSNRCWRSATGFPSTPSSRLRDWGASPTARNSSMP